MAFCERRWALVQLENIWADNRFTAEGKELHERAHSEGIESRPGMLIRRTLPVHSLRLGISGQADVVEFEPVRDGSGGIKLEGRRGLWRPYPIEYKRSRDKAGSVAYRVQLCAQALCFEEMLGVPIPEGAVYDGSARRRQIVAFDLDLRANVEALARRMHELFRQRKTPAPELKKACQSCSLYEPCRPQTLSRKQPVTEYLRRGLANLEKAG